MTEFGRSYDVGAYLGNPDGSSASGQASFDASYNSFVALMRAAPAYLDNFIDYSQPISDWVANTGWQAWSNASSDNARSATPVIALPMASNAAGSASADAQFQAFASGQYDSVLKGIVSSWTAMGYKNLVFRPGWEMNLQGPTYAGDSAQSQADWVAAFKHIYNVLHTAGDAQGAKITVVWNPGTTNYSNAGATTALYPGDAYVDQIGADIYADAFPYTSGAVSLTQFLTDATSRANYWSSPAATAFSADGSDGHSQSFQSLIDFAQAHNKPFAIPETGAGNSNAGTDVQDDAAFPAWLAQQLTAAQAKGVDIGLVNLWNSNGGGNYEFSFAADGKPQEAAAWAQYFGQKASDTTGGSAAPAGQPSNTGNGATTASPITLGSGADTIALSVAEDAWQGNAEYTVSVDGRQVGGVQTATASHAAGQSQQLLLKGDWGSGTNVVAINYLNDAFGGTADTDRNLYLLSAGKNGTPSSDGARVLQMPGAQTVLVGSAQTAKAETANAGTGVIALRVSEDAWQGDAQFTVSVDGRQIGGVHTTTAAHGAGQTQDLTVDGQFAVGQHSVSLNFLNDASGGMGDRNLYLDAISFNGQASGSTLALLGSGAQSVTVTSATAYNPGNAGGTITTHGNDTVNIGSGAVTVHAEGPSTTIFGGAGSVLIDNVSGQLNFTAGSGPATIQAGSGKDIYNIVNGQAGGSLTISDFTPGQDFIHLSGYSGTGIDHQSIVNGSLQIVLTDKTQISLIGVTSFQNQSIFS